VSRVDLKELSILLNTPSSYFYWVDLLVALAIPLLFVFLYRTRRISRFSWLLFWIGCAVGALWEIPFYFIGPSFLSDPLYVLKTPTPFPLFLLHVMHCFWDGGLLMIGVELVKKLCRSPHFTQFRFQELAVLLVWGGFQELAVELLSSGSSGWAYVPHWWNPSMFQFQGSDITLLPQLIWVIAPIVFYVLALLLAKSVNEKLPVKSLMVDTAMNKVHSLRLEK